MSAKNIDHDAVKDALIADGWTITDDPLHVSIGERDFYVDLALERDMIVAERGTNRIAIEIQSFISKSTISDFHAAVGQFLVYRSCMKAVGIERKLYLAVPDHSIERIWGERIGVVVRVDHDIRLVSYAIEPPRIVQWIEPNDIAIS